MSCISVDLNENATLSYSPFAPHLNMVHVEATLLRSKVRGGATCHAFRDRLRKMDGVPSLLTTWFATKSTVLGEAGAI